jgi:hypothetical protein
MACRLCYKRGLMSGQFTTVFGGLFFKVEATDLRIFCNLLAKLQLPLMSQADAKL